MQSNSQTWSHQQASRDSRGSPTSPSSESPLMNEKLNGESMEESTPRRQGLRHRLGEIFDDSQSQADEEIAFGVPVTITKVADFPKGYGRAAAIQASDPQFLIYRKFGWARCMVLLDLQDQIVALEDHLQELLKDQEYDGEHTRLMSRRVDYSNKNSREELVSDLNSKLQQYDDLLLRSRSILALNRPSKNSQSSVYNAIVGEANIHNDEGGWIRRSDDIVAAAQDSDNYGWVNAWFERFLHHLSRPLYHGIFSNSELRSKSLGMEKFYLVSKTRIDIPVRLAYVVLISLLLLTPIYMLFRLQPNHRSEILMMGHKQFLVIFVFTFVFSGSLWLFTSIKRQDAFAMTAAYAAVLTIFLGSSSGGCGLPP